MVTIGREGVDIEYEGIASGADGGVASGYLAKPASDAGCGIVVIHDEWGLTEFIRDVCDRLARAGFVALAPDLFRGRTAKDSITAAQLSKEFELDGVDADLESAVAELYNQNATAGSKVGALGFGLGGSLALFLSSRHRRIGAVVDLYGTRLEVVDELERVAAPVLAVLAGGDESGAESAVNRLKSGLERAGVNASVEVRAGIRSGYMNDARLDVHDATAAADSWDALLAFFRSELS
jgi:carboxymethylenebutenolidase